MSPKKSRRPSTFSSSSQSKCCGVIEEATYNARAKRAARTKAQPWIVLKLMVFVTIAIIGYSAYVFIGRLCVNLIRRRDGKKRGIGSLLAGFSVLFLWIAWAYIKVILTPPGVARDYVQRTPRPPFPEPPRVSISSAGAYDREPGVGGGRGSVGGPSYENIPPVVNFSERLHPFDVETGRTGVSSNPNDMPENGEQRRDDRGIRDNSRENHNDVDVNMSGGKMGREKSNSYSERMRTQVQHPVNTVQRRPSSVAVLSPVHRYCSIDEIVKPYRTHHCRACGTCILKYDHHCPWIGQCVGARNQKFFLNFVQAASVYTVYTFVTLVVFMAHDARDNIEPQVENRAGDIDPQKIVIIALAALFALFTITLQVTHIRLILSGRTTLESLQARYMKDREDRALRDAGDGFFGCTDVRHRRRRRREWDAEWGRIDQEGNIWWLGNTRREWEEVMGRNFIGWILPIGRSLNDGLTYPVNRRFDAQGIWRRRAEWPAELR